MRQLEAPKQIGSFETRFNDQILCHLRKGEAGGFEHMTALRQFHVLAGILLALQDCRSGGLDLTQSPESLSHQYRDIPIECSSNSKHRPAGIADKGTSSRE